MKTGSLGRTRSNRILGKMKSLKPLRFQGFWLRGKDLNLRPLGYEPNEPVFIRAVFTYKYCDYAHFCFSVYITNRNNHLSPNLYDAGVRQHLSIPELLSAQAAMFDEGRPFMYTGITHKYNGDSTWNLDK